VLVFLPSSRTGKHVTGSIVLAFVSSYTLYLLLQPLPLIASMFSLSICFVVELQMLLSCVLEVPGALVMTCLL